jgi:hypothetical protein
LGTRGHVELKRWPTAVVLMLQLSLNEFAYVFSIDKTFWNVIWKIKFIFPFWRLLIFSQYFMHIFQLAQNEWQIMD